VGDDGEHGPGRIGIEVPRGAVREPSPFLQVPDGEFDHGMAAVVGVEVDRIPDAIGEALGNGI